MSVINSIPLIAAGDDGYQISRSVRLRTSAGGYFNRTPSSSGSTTQWTLSTWVKRGTLGTFTSIFSACITGNPYYQSVLAFDSSDRLWYYQFSNSSVYTVNVTSTAVFRDPSAWYHVVMKFDATTSSMIVWVNNQQVINSSSFSTTFRYINTTNTHYIGNYAYQSVGPGVYDGYLAEFNFIDGQALTPSSFGETDAVTGVWKPKKYAGTYGTNGFYLNFSDNSSNTAATIGKDSSGNGNNWTPNNISVTAGTTYDSMLDTPTPYADGGNGRGNYAVLNPIAGAVSGATFTITQANLYAVLSSSSNVVEVPATMALPSTGQWYWEINVVSVNTTYSQPLAIGISDQGGIGNSTGFSNNYYYYLSKTGNKYSNGTSTAYGSSFTANDVIGVAFDAGAGTLTFYKNNTSQGTAYSSLTAGPYYPKFGCNDGSTIAVNFGQRPFSYTTPTGFKALNTQNLPEATIKKGNAYFDVLTWTGDGTSSRAITGLNFQPDLVWDKMRSGAYQHAIVDAVRGGNQVLHSNSTSAEDTNWQYGYVSSFNSNGFTIQAGSTSAENWNLNGSTFVAWNWKESVTAGLDIVTYTSSVGTVAHNLGVAPSMIIMKPRNNTDQWTVGHKSLNGGSSPWNYGIPLNTTAATQTNSGFWNNTAPTSSVFSTGSWNSGFNMVAYCFAEVAGFSRFGSYQGNGSSDGPFIYTGMKSRFIMIKESSGSNAASASWIMFDTSRDVDNVTEYRLFANLSDAEVQTSAVGLDILSNGFKPRTTNFNINESGGTYIYAAFAENPFKNSLAR